MNESHPTIVPDYVPINPELDELSDLIRKEKVILWVGSGFSSYAGYPSASHLQNIIIEKLRRSGKTPTLKSDSLKETADHYVAVNGRDSLIDMLREYYGAAPQRSEVHEKLALINRIKYIITTNYDTLLEFAYQEKMEKIIHEDELPSLSDHQESTVLLKIHGDLSDPDSIVITTDDYEKVDKSSITLDKIKSLLAVYSVAFIGYSIRDSYIEEMLRDIDQRLKLRRHPYFFIDRKIDEEKKKHLRGYNLHFIEMDAATAINFIAEKAIQYSYLDSERNPAILMKSGPIFKSRECYSNCTIADGKITHLSLIPMRSGIQNEIKVTISSKTNNNTQFLNFYNSVTGQTFDPVILTDAECNISVRGGEMNGIFIFDPAIKTYPALFMTPPPAEITDIDLKSQDGTIELSKLPMKINKSEVLLKFEIQDPGFSISIMMKKGKRDEFTFSIHRIVPDIERGRLIYSLFDRWMRGEELVLISDRLPAPFHIPPAPSSEISPHYPIIHALSQLYTDLLDIQHILKENLIVPNQITEEDQQVIRNLVDFLRGKKQKVPEIHAKIKLKTNDPAPLIENQTLSLKGSGSIGTLEISFFGRSLNVPYAIDGSEIFFSNALEIVKLMEQGITEVPVLMKSKTDQLYIMFSH
jgi:hypothetical protein